MRGIGHIKELARLAGADGRPYLEALLRMAVEDGDEHAEAMLRKVRASIPPHNGEPSHLEPSVEKHCSFCDPQLPNGNIPGCKRPPTQKIRAVMLGEPSILDVCDHHYERMPEESRPITPYKLEDKDVAEYLSKRKMVQVLCTGCGAVLVNMAENDALGLAFDAAGISVLVIKKHLDQCPWRRLAQKG